MNEENINKTGRRPLRVLIVPLDWGLGHSTRCIPIIDALQKKGLEVLLAAEGLSSALLQAEFPTIRILPLKGYRITYSKNRHLFFFKLMQQLPRLLATVGNEKKWLDKTILSEKIDLVISDNRLGLSTSLVPCIYITHQLFIQTGNRLLNKIAQKIHYNYINRYHQCWVPDEASAPNLAGRLSHPVIKPVTPITYLGALSRFKKQSVPVTEGMLILLSGPEPQRSIFENLVIKQLRQTGMAATLVRGLPGLKENCQPPNGLVKIYNHLQAAELERLIQQSTPIIARAGYSTIMDLVKLQKDAILVPTPGQSEQEYLGQHLMKEKLFLMVSQEKFELKNILKQVAAFEFYPKKSKSSPIEKIIEEVLDSMQVTVQ